MGHKRSLDALLAEKQQKIATLELQLKAQEARASLLQSHLSSTLDAMETLKFTHDRNLAAEVKAKHQLNIKLNQFTEYNQAVEKDRDELRDAVLSLVEKVESCNDYSVWPYSHIQLPNPLEPLAQPGEEMVSKTNEADVGATADFMPIIVASLRAALEKERASHARTHDQAELEILSLRAQLARRDAELAACVIHTDHSSLVPALDPIPNVESTSKRDKIPASSLTPEEAVRVLGLSAVKNRELEIEIKQLASRLEAARAQTRVPTPLTGRTTYHRSTDATLNEANANDLLHGAAGVSGRASPRSPNLEPFAPHDSPSPYAMTPLDAATPFHAPTAPSLERGTANQAIGKFEEQIKRIGEEIDAFKARRQGWSEVMEAEKVISTSTAHPPDAQVDRGHSELADLHVKFIQLKETTAKREAELEAEIACLKCTIAEQATLTPGTLISLESPGRVGPVPTQPVEETHWEDNDAEQSMELATPLQPTIVLSDGETITMTNAPVKDVEPHMIPLPEPQSSSSPPQAPSLRDRPPTPFSFASPTASNESPAKVRGDNDKPNADERLSVLERELDNARKEVAERDMALVEMRTLVNDLRIEIKETV